MGTPGSASRSSVGPAVEGTLPHPPTRATRGISTGEGGGGTLDSVPVALKPEPHPPGECGEQFKTCSGLSVGSPAVPMGPNGLCRTRAVCNVFGASIGEYVGVHAGEKLRE